MPAIQQASQRRHRAPLVLLWGPPEEDALAAVGRALQAHGAETVLVDQRRAMSTRFLPGPDGPLLRLPDRALPLADVTAVYPRPYPLLPEIPGDGPATLVAHRHVARLERELWHWTATTAATVVNPPGAAASNSTKPFQTQVARACGFDVPDSLLTTDPDHARTFAARHQRVVYKAAGGARSLAGLLDLADACRLERLSTCPVYLQKYIAGTNVRVHTAGTCVFAAEITSDAVDYRRNVQQMVPISLPSQVAGRCQVVTKALGLLVAGIDLIRTPAGRWYFLEANTSPAFTFYPDDNAVAAAIAGILLGLPVRG